MLQYPLPLPPLSLTSSRKSKDRSGNRSNDASAPPLPPLPTLNNRRQTTDTRSPSSSFLSAFTTHHPNAFSISPSANTTPLPSPSPASSTPVSFPGPSSAHPWRPPKPSAHENADPSRRSSTASELMGDVLSPGDLVGEGVPLQGENTRLVSMPDSLDYEAPAQEFEVVRRLGTGSYAVVYLVREVVSRPAYSHDSHMSLDGMELDDKVSRRQSIEYGRDFAIKCLSKANLDEDALKAQMSEVTIHQSLNPHPNIATLHRTLETSSFLLLLLEFVPGEDLFYFLEQARDHFDDSPSSELAISSSRTPPTPSLLSNLHPSQLLSRNRLRLIASMFSQMCEAVAACHDQQVFHRDIKPENFIVTDGYTTVDGRRQRKVVVKLTDFGLSTTDLESSDMDCGSAPYMSYECRNNVAPTYKPRAADVWSLGIVLINMLYHFNPWQDTAEGACNSFDLYRSQPTAFFMQRFAGMTEDVAKYLTSKVFCILEDPKDDSPRVQAREFGSWVKDLPSLLGDTSVTGHKRVTSISSCQGYPIAHSNPGSRLPSSRQPSLSLRAPNISARPRSRAASLAPTLEVEGSELPTVYDQEPEDQDQGEDGMYSRSASNNKRRKRGARKGKNAGVLPPALPLSPGSPLDDTLQSLASASESLAREISKASRSSSKHRGDLPLESPDLPPVPVISQAPMTKKASKWKLGFGKNSTSTGERAPKSPVEEQAPPLPSATASNVTNLIMGLNAPAPTPSGLSQTRSRSKPRAPRSAGADGDEWNRGRRPKQPPPPLPRQPPRRYSPPSMYSGIGTFLGAPEPKKPTSPAPRAKSPRALSPQSTRSGGRPSGVSSAASTNWRNSTSTTSSAATSSSAFTRLSNNSARSISTANTSVSASSWRTQQAQPKPKPHSPTALFGHDMPAVPPKNVKIMNGVPWELHELPRSQYPGANPTGDIFGQPPPPRKPRVRNTKPKDHLDTISERSNQSPRTALPISESEEAMRSNPDLEEEVYVEDENGVTRVVQKGQINALAKMLSALRR